MSNSIDNSDAFIDSRDVIARIEELESDIESWNADIETQLEEISDKETEIEELESEIEILNEGDLEDVAEMLEERTNNIEALRSDIVDIEDNIKTVREDIEDAEKELAPLESLAEEAEGYSADWRYGATLIRDDYFEQYAKELVQDIGDLPAQLPSYIENNIDWEGVASDIQVDYTSVDFDGEEYWIR
jgi:chromosome segregation ATPase